MENFEFNTSIKSQLEKTRYWTKFLSVFGFVMIGLIVLIGLGMFFAPDMAYLGFMYLIMGVIYYFPTQYLYDFSKKIKTSLQNNDPKDLEESFENLASFFKFFGVLIIIYLILLALMFIGSIFVFMSS